MFSSFSYVIFFEAYLRQQTLEEDTEKARCDFLLEMTAEDCNEVKKGFKDSFAYIIKMRITERVSFFEDALPDRLHELTARAMHVLEHSLILLEGIDNVFPLAVHRSGVGLEKVVGVWAKTMKEKRWRLGLTVPNDHEGVLYHDVSDALLKTYKKLVTDTSPEFNYIATNLLLCAEVANIQETVRSDILCYHGYKEKCRIRQVRDLRLQDDILSIWDCFKTNSTPIVEKICQDEGLKATLHNNNKSLFWKSVQSRTSIN